MKCWNGAIGLCKMDDIGDVNRRQLRKVASPCPRFHAHFFTA